MAMNQPHYWQSGIAAKALTTMEVGAMVPTVAKPTTPQQVLETITFAKQQGLAIVPLGGGSNTVLPDSPLQAVIVKYAGQTVSMQEPGIATQRLRTTPRYRPQGGDGYLQLDTEDTLQGQLCQVTLGAGMPWGQAVMTTLRLGLAGLHSFARIPACVGGAVYNNAHSATQFVGDFVTSVQACDIQSVQQHTYTARDLAFDYDTSLFHQTAAIITDVTFELVSVGQDATKPYINQYVQRTQEKSRIQPKQPSSGSVFQNLHPEAVGREASLSAAWYIDQAGCKGLSVGGMQVFEGQANFIINQGGTQADFIALVELVRQRVYQHSGIWLVPEVQCLRSDGTWHIWTQQ
jgi:UDP-N-acetylmuramate dehydrogenase